MNAIIFATTGTSALTNQEIGDVVVREKVAVVVREKGAQLRSDVRTYLRPAAPEVHERRAAELDLERRLAEAHEAYFQQSFSVCLEPRNYPMSAAELTSMPALLEAIRGRGEKLERLVLLASDTPEGKLAARVVQRVLSTPACFQLDATVEVAEISGLNATFENQLERLGGAIDEHKSHVAPPRRVYINLTGGFKGTVPFLTQLAWTHGYALYYQHEVQSRSEIVELPGVQVAPDAQPKVTLVYRPARYRRRE